MPYCLNQKMSLSPGNKGAPERKEKHKAYLTAVITCILTALQGRGLLALLSSAAILGQQLIFTQAATSVFQQGLLSFGCCFCCDCSHFVFK